MSPVVTAHAPAAASSSDRFKVATTAFSYFSDDAFNIIRIISKTPKISVFDKSQGQGLNDPSMRHDQ